MTSYRPCAYCHRRTRGSVRFPDRGESHRTPACSEHKELVRARLAEQVSPELRLLAAIFGGIHRMPHPPVVSAISQPGPQLPVGLSHKRITDVETGLL